jgi:hypothetical protein
MPPTSKFLKVAAAFLLTLFAGVQFVRPARVNPPVVAGLTLEERASVTPEVAGVLKRSCMDCHSNGTNWPWYSNVAPVSWFVIDHVNHGRRHLNFSEWGEYDHRKTEYLLKDICKTAKSGFMPLDSYTLIHRGARLTPADVKDLCDWSGAEQRRLASLAAPDAR